MPSFFCPNRPALTSAALLIAAAITFGGCSTAPKTAHVAGTITITGQAPPAGSIVRLNISPTAAEKGPGAGSQVTGNKYDCPNCPLGKVTVYVSVDRPPTAATAENRENTSLIDPIYSAGINLDVVADNLKQDFDLKPFKPSP
jgi:hypothetical protein